MRRAKDFVNSSYSSTKQGNVVKRLLVLLVMTISLMFAGGQSTPTTQASVPCDMVCSDYIDPADGQCYTRCCPADELCKTRCVIMPCGR
jgi:hypothetical protein